MVPTQGRCALVSLTKHHHRQFLSADHLHHGLLRVCLLDFGCLASLAGT